MHCGRSPLFSLSAPLPRLRCPQLCPCRLSARPSLLWLVRRVPLVPLVPHVQGQRPDEGGEAGDTGRWTSRWAFLGSASVEFLGVLQCRRASPCSQRDPLPQGVLFRHCGHLRITARKSVSVISLWNLRCTCVVEGSPPVGHLFSQVCILSPLAAEGLGAPVWGETARVRTECPGT